MGPKLPFSKLLHAQKYRATGESFRDSTNRVASALTDTEEEYRAFRSILQDMRFLPGGRVQAGMGSSRKVTALNCFVSSEILDDSDSILVAVNEAYHTLRMGGGIGYDFSNIRPRGAMIKTLGAQASGPVSFMGIFDAVCKTVQSAGHRRGAQMGVLRVDHPDIEEFIHCKQDQTSLTAFNVSIGITDEFMEAVRDDKPFNLTFEGQVYSTVRAVDLWDTIMRSTWDWAEPGVLFVDRINEYNNLWYCERVSATNPCGEQPLGPNASCLLGSFNLVQYLTDGHLFNYDQFRKDIRQVVRAMDNVIDRTHYPIEKQRQTHQNNRRMGLGITGTANAIESMGYQYGSNSFVAELNKVLTILRDESYLASIELAQERGPFPLYDERYLESAFVKTLPTEIQELIKLHGIRNSHLTSIAPTGTISLTADNVSSGIEPVFSYQFDRVVQEFDGSRIETVTDYGFREFGVEGKTTDSVTIDEHLAVLLTSQKYMDSAVSKTCNVPTDISWEDFKSVYMRAWEGGAKGCTTYRLGGKREGILKSESTGACYIDPDTGVTSCGD